jgi:hypothetical protein
MPQQFGFNLDNFLNGLQEVQAKQKTNKDFDRSKSLQYVNLAHPDNYGKYQILPMLSTATYSPYVYLFNTREVKLQNPKKPDATTWYKILPDEAYMFMDETGRVVSALTDAERGLLAELRGLYDKLATYPGAKDITRIKNYTLFQGKCINQYDIQNKVKKSNFNALFICTSKGVASAVNDDINNQAISFGGVNFVSQIYTRQQNGRTGWLIFSINRAVNGVGFDVKVTHTPNIPIETTQPYDFTDEDMELFQDPVRTFLTWQGGQDKAYNPEVLTELKFKIIDLINKYDGASSSIPVGVVQQATTQTATAAVQGAPVPTSADPMVARMQAEQMPPQAPQTTMATDQQFVQSQNTNPFQTPPAANIDPISGVPVNPTTAPQQQYQAPVQGAQPFAVPGQTQYQQPQQAPQPQAAAPSFQAPAWAQPAAAPVESGSMPFPTDPSAVNPFKQ